MKKKEKGKKMQSTTKEELQKEHVAVEKSNRNEQLKPNSKQDFWGFTINKDFEEKSKQKELKCPSIIESNHVGD